MEHVPNIVVGAGIAGVYLGLQLQDKNEKFVMFEKNGRSRGKQRSVDFCGGIAELGSSVVHSNQSKILGLGKRLGLTFSRLDKSEKSMILLLDYDDKSSKSAFRSVRKKVEAASLQLEETSEKTLDEVVSSVCSPLEAYIMRWGWDCWYENADMNAFALFQSQKQEGDYMVCDQGLEQLLIRPDLPIEFDSAVTHIEFDLVLKKFTLRVNKDEKVVNYTCDKLYLTVDIVSLTKIGFSGFPSSFFRVMSCGQPVPSCRYYVCLDKPIPTGKITSIVGDPDRWPFKWSLRVSPTMWLISYVDGPLVAQVHKEKDKLVARWCDYMSELFKVQLTSKNVVDVVAAWWKDSFTLLNKAYFANGYQLKPSPRRFMGGRCICTTLPTVKDQAWMEGHLYDLSLE